MEEVKIYWSGIEYKYGKGSSNYGKLQGGFVYGFKSTESAAEDHNKTLQESQKYKRTR